MCYLCLCFSCVILGFAASGTDTSSASLDEDGVVCIGAGELQVQVAHDLPEDFLGILALDGLDMTSDPPNLTLSNSAHRNTCVHNVSNLRHSTHTHCEYVNT